MRTIARQRENTLLLAASRCPGARPRPLAADGGYDWHYLLDAAERQGVSALLRQLLADDQTIAAPDWARAALDATYWGQHFRNRSLLESFTAVLAQAADEGLSIMPLKGAALVNGYYPVASLRPMSDLDLLVRPDDTERMADLLQDCGYTPATRPVVASDSGDMEYAYVSHRAEGAILIEYRSEPLDPINGFPVSLDAVLMARLREHAARMWERGRAGAYADMPVVCIAPEDLLLHITSHLATRHAGFRLLWLHDVCRVLVAHPTEFDWRYFWAEAAILNLTVPVEAAFEAAYRWLDAPRPGGSGSRLPLVRGKDESLLPSMTYVERRIAERAVADLDRADMAVERQRAWPEAISAFCRLTSVRAQGRVLLFFVIPSREYLVWWMINQGRPTMSYRQMLIMRWRQICAEMLRNARTQLIAIARRAAPVRSQ